MQDPEPYLKDQNLTVQDPLDPSRTAILDAAHRSFVNYEIYFFADDATKRRFDATPLRWCGTLTDPVTRERFAPGDDAPRRDLNGRTFFFASASSAEMFDAMTDMYFLPDYRMLPAPEPSAPQGAPPPAGPSLGSESAPKP